MVKSARLLCLATAAVLVCSGHALAQAEVNFESRTDGESFGTPNGDSPGDVVFTENGIDVGVDNFTFTSSGTSFNALSIGTGFGPPSFSGNVASVIAILADFDFTGLPYAVTGVSFDYDDAGGEINLGVNGTVVVAEDFTDIVGPIDGVAVAVNDSGGRGSVQLSGSISSLQVGGLEFAMDNVVAVPEPGTLALGLVGAALIGLRRRR